MDTSRLRMDFCPWTCFAELVRWYIVEYFAAEDGQVLYKQMYMILRYERNENSCWGVDLVATTHSWMSDDLSLGHSISSSLCPHFLFGMSKNDWQSPTAVQHYNRCPVLTSISTPSSFLALGSFITQTAAGVIAQCVSWCPCLWWL